VVLPWLFAFGTFRQRRHKQATVAPGILLLFKFKMSLEANFIQFLCVCFWASAGARQD